MIMNEEQENFMLAVIAGATDEVTSLLSSGFNPKYTTSGKQTPLHGAIDSEIGWADPNPTSPVDSLVLLLLEHGVDPNIIDSYGNTAMDIAIGDGGILHQTAYDALKRFGGKTAAQLRSR